MRREKTNNEGFTLVELIIVVAIIALLIAMIAPNLTSFLGTASDTTYKANAKTAFTASNAWATQMRVAGATPKAGTVVITSNGTTVTADYTAVTAPTGSQPKLEDLFNAAEITSTTAVNVYLNDNWAVTKVEWGNNGGTVLATYPEASTTTPAPTTTP